MLDVRRLRVLRELAAQGSVAATALALGYTPPAISQQLAALEREAGVALLEPEGRGRRLTEAGLELVARTESILREIEAAEAALARGRDGVAGTLRVGSFASALRALMVPAVARVEAAHPQLQVVTHELEPEESVPALKRRELDLVLAQDYAFRPGVPDPAVERVPLCDDRVRLAVPRGSSWDRGAATTVGGLRDAPWVAGREGTWCHAVVLHAAREAGFEPRITHHTNDFAVSHALVASGVAVALVADLAGDPPDAVARYEIADRPLARRIFATVRAGSSEHPAVAALIAELRTAGAATVA